MSTSRSTGAALDYAAHRLSCEACLEPEFWGLCPDGEALLDARIAAVDEPYRKTLEYGQQVTELLAQCPPEVGDRLVATMLARYIREVSE